MDRISVLFENDGQERELWCWAAVVANVKNCFKLMTPGPFFERTRQCEVVRAAFAYAGGPDDPCVPGSAFDDELGVQVGLGALDGGTFSPSFQLLKDELGKGLNAGAMVNPNGTPVCATIQSKVRGLGPGEQSEFATHAVAISATNDVSTGDAAEDYRHVWVEDPYYGPQNVIEFDFEDFVANYDFRETTTPGEPVVLELIKVIHP